MYFIGNSIPNWIADELKDCINNQSTPFQKKKNDFVRLQDISSNSYDIGNSIKLQSIKNGNEHNPPTLVSLKTSFNYLYNQITNYDNI
ncbi:unnamed protein product [Cunninghamella blakesleeana]